ncbi:hypothetical protein G9A89_011224 [Geosiphon pyriformis]|nr:hypothetical protein G9A89_011224 [Geosiphon pyriformis]
MMHFVIPYCVVHIFLGCGLSLGDQVNNSFHFHGGTPLLSILGRAVFDWRTFKYWKRLDLHGPVPEWFKLSIDFLDSVASSPVQFLPIVGTKHLDILEFSEFGLIYNQLWDLEADSFSIYTDESLKGLGNVDIKTGAAVFFEDISLSLGVRVSGLMFSTLVELQAIMLAFKCVPFNSLCLVPHMKEHFILADGNVVSDLHMAADFTSKSSAGFCTYFIKALYHQLPVAVQKQLYNRCYFSVLYLYCDKIEVSDHAFSFMEAVSVFGGAKIAGQKVVKFVHNLCLAFRDEVWLVHAKHCVCIKKSRIIPIDSSALVSVLELPALLSAGVVKLLSIVEAIGIGFGFCKACLFFLGVGDSVLVHISV